LKIKMTDFAFPGPVRVPGGASALKAASGFQPSPSSPNPPAWSTCRRVARSPGWIGGVIEVKA